MIPIFQFQFMPFINCGFILSTLVIKPYQAGVTLNKRSHERESLLKALSFPFGTVTEKKQTMKRNT